MEEKDMDKLFREAFKDAEETPSAAMWDKITAELDDAKENSVALPTKRNKIWLLSAAAAAILLIGGISLLFVKNTNEPRTPQTAATPTVTTMPDTMPAQGVPKEKDGTNTLLSASTIQLVERSKTQHEEPKNIQPEVQIPIGGHASDIDEKIIAAQDIPKTVHTASPSIAQQEPTKEVPVRRVTEIEDIKPLIEPEEDESSMLASIDPPKERNNVVTSVLNTITNNIESDKTKDIRFSVDDEGSIKINLFNTIVRNRTKNKK